MKKTTIMAMLVIIGILTMATAAFADGGDVEIDLTELSEDSSNGNWSYTSSDQKLSILGAGKTYSFSGQDTKRTSIRVYETAENVVLKFADGASLDAYSSGVYVEAKGVEISVRGTVSLGGNNGIMFYNGDNGGVITLDDGAVLNVIRRSTSAGISCTGNLLIKGNGEINSTTSSAGSWGSYGMRVVNGDLTLSGEVEVNAYGAGIGSGLVIQMWNEVDSTLTVEEDCKLFALAKGSGGHGISIDSAGLFIKGNGSVTAQGKGTGYAFLTLKSYDEQEYTVNIMGGTVAAFNYDNPENICKGSLNHLGGTLNGERPKANITIFPRTFDTGICANGTPLLILEDGSDEAVVRTTIYIDSNGNGALDEGELSLSEAGVDGAPENGSDLTYWAVLGGTKDTPYTGDTLITMRGGKVKFLLGGGNDNDAVLTGNTRVRLIGGETDSHIYGGGQYAKVIGDTEVLVSGGYVGGAVYGGSESAQIQGNTYVNVTGNPEINYGVYGGNNSNSNVTDSTTVIFSGGITRDIFGGGHWGLLFENTSVTVDGGIVTDCVHGGGYGHEVNNANVLVSGNAQVGSVYGGGRLLGSRTKISTLINIEGNAVVSDGVHVDGENSPSIGSKSLTVSEIPGDRAGYSFGGWFTDSEYSNPAVFNEGICTVSKGSLYAKWSPNTYTITFDGNGGIPNPPTLMVTYDEPYGELPAISLEGYEFKGWFTQPVGGTKVDAADTVKTASEHSLYAQWELICYAVIYELDGGVNSPDNPADYSVEIYKITLKAPSKGGYTFLGWYDAEEGGNQVTEITQGSMGDITLYAKWSVATGGNDGGGGSSMPPAPPAPPAPPVPPAPPSPLTPQDRPMAEAAAETTIDGDHASASLNADKVAKAIEEAEEIAPGETAPPPTLRINANTGGSADSLTVTITEEVLSLISNSNVGDLLIESDLGSILIDRQTLEALRAESGGEGLIFEIKKVDTSQLSPQQQSGTGNAAVFDISIKSGGGAFGSASGSIASYRVSVPYVLQPGQSNNGVVVFYINPNGIREKMAATYDETAQMATFATNHFSVYAVMYDEEEAFAGRFEDVKKGAWYYEDAVYAYMNGLLSGISDTSFGPEITMTRGMFAAVIHRLEGSPAARAESRSADVSAGMYYWDAIAWTKENSIISGYGDNKFGPEDEITREQLAAILKNYADYKGNDTSEKADISGFADREQISPWANEAISWANKAGIIQGSDNKLMPAAKASRGQAAAMLRRFIEQGKQ